VFFRFRLSILRDFLASSDFINHIIAIRRAFIYASLQRVSINHYLGAKLGLFFSKYLFIYVWFDLCLVDL